MDNISLEMSVYWLSKNVVSFKIEVGICEKFAKKYDTNFDFLCLQAESIAAV